MFGSCTDLPVNYDNFSTKEKGRVTRAAAMALKSRVTLYMASLYFQKIVKINGNKPQKLLMILLNRKQI